MYTHLLTQLARRPLRQPVALLLLQQPQIRKGNPSLLP
jgi:hypothetical protein